MLELRTKIKMMSVNQMTMYHIIVEVFNILYTNSAEQINKKYRHQDRHSLRKNTNNFFYLVLIGLILSAREIWVKIEMFENNNTPPEIFQPIAMW